jgi:hypothetical protein
MASQHLLAGDGVNWCGEGGLDYERLLFGGLGHPGFLFLLPRHTSACTTFLDPPALARSRLDMASPFSTRFALELALDPCVASQSTRTPIDDERNWRQVA